MIDWTIIKLLAWTESYFKDHCIDSPRLTAEILLGFGLGIRRLDLYLQHDRPLEKAELTRFKALIKRRIGREPVAYITGEKGFYESDFQVKKGVLIPRPDTEVMVETAIGLLGRVKRLPEKKGIGAWGRIRGHCDIFGQGLPRACLFRLRPVLCRSGDGKTECCFAGRNAHRIFSGVLAYCS